MSSSNKVIVRNALQREFDAIGKLIVEVYAALDGFPKPGEQPVYYEMLANIGLQTNKPQAELIVAVDTNENLLGAVVYYGDMQYYGSGGTATSEKNAAGFRLLAVADEARGKGVGKLLTLKCIEKAKEAGLKNMVIHSTKAMQVAWGMYEKIGFQRAEDLDFMQAQLLVFGFRLALKNN